MAISFEPQTLDFEGYQLKYYTFSSVDKPLLLMIHGYTSSHQVWRQTIPVLENDYYCVAIDLLGHG